MPASTYGAFALLPDRTRYQSLAEIEARLSYDLDALDALCEAARQPSTSRGAWNLLLLGCARYLARYLRAGEELGALLGWLVEALARKERPLSFLRCAVKDARKSREAAQERELEATRLTQASGELSSATEGEDRVWAGSQPLTDPLLREQLQGAMDKLSPRQLRAFLLVEVEALSAKEAGQEMGLAPKTVRNLASEARKILRDTLSNVSPNDS